MIRNLLPWSVAAAIAGLAISAPAPAQGRTLTQLVASSGGEFDRNWSDHDILLNAVQTARLAGALDDRDADLTLFAPTDAAFVLLARDLGFLGIDEAGAWRFLVDALTRLGDGDPIPVLTDVLLYHVIGESLAPREVAFARSLATLQGGTIRPFLFVLRDAEPDLRDPIVLYWRSRSAVNGVLYPITRVLLPIDLP